jgi:hypothetical protein
MRENDVASHVEKKPFRRDVGAGEASGLGRLVDQEPVGLAMLVEARGRAESRRACADDEDADLLKKIEENLKRGKKSASREVERRRKTSLAAKCASWLKAAISGKNAWLKSNDLHS